jgi:hypothetical protein
MTTREHSVRELHVAFEPLPRVTFKVQADTQEKACGSWR